MDKMTCKFFSSADCKGYTFVHDMGKLPSGIN